MELDSILHRGNIHFEQKRYDSAMAEARNVLAQEPTNVDALQLLANCLLHLGEPDKADEAIESAIKLDPTDYLSLQLKAVALFQQRKFEKALKYIDNSISFMPVSAESHGFKAAVLFELARFEEALAAANKGLSLDANSISCLNQRAAAQQKLGRKEDSYETIKEALHGDPQNSHTHANLGFALLENGDPEKAKVHFKEALRLDPTNEYARQGMLHAIKGTNFIYRQWLNYVFWLQGVSPRARIIFVVGAFLLFRFIGSIKESLGSFEFLADIVLIAYSLFAISSWIITPVSNMFLRFHSFGKYVLTDEEKTISNYTAGVAALSLVGFAIMFLSDSDIVMQNFGLYAACYGIAFMVVISAIGNTEKRNRKKILTVGLIFIGWALLVMLMAFMDPALALSMFNISVWGFIGFQFYSNSVH